MFLKRRAGPKRERFSLLLLEPGETYFKDYQVNYEHSFDDSSERVSWNARLRVCSKSLLFEPLDDSKLAIIKVLLKDIKEAPDADEEGRVVEFSSARHSLLLDGNVVKPFSWVEGVHRHRFVFSFGASAATNCTITQILKLWKVMHSRVLTESDREHMQSSIVDCALAVLEFDKRNLQHPETILAELNCKLIGPLTAQPGKAVLTDKRVLYCPVNDPTELKEIKLTDVKRVLRRRYCLQNTGVEIYCQEKSLVSELYLALADNSERELLVNLILQQESVTASDRNYNSLPEMTRRWQNKTISNYDYLLYLNIMGDRSINDIHQYPVFPWVIADYDSDQLDLSDPATFRDLTKPIGALDEARLQMLKERFEEMEDPKFLYGTHYSNPAFVLYFLVRVVPECLLCLQNGHFDHADRAFHSVKEVWNNVLHCHHDFKELIPEFYEGDGSFLLNEKRLDLGTREDGTVVDHVILPPWANGDPAEFVAVNRRALESDHVSAHLHHWIDLMFGYKQRGEPAFAADNVFHPWTYEGGAGAMVEQLYHTDCSTLAQRAQILEFGQSPVQLFHRRHVPRDMPAGRRRRFNGGGDANNNPNGGGAVSSGGKNLRGQLNKTGSLLNPAFTSSLNSHHTPPPAQPQPQPGQQSPLPQPPPPAHVPRRVDDGMDGGRSGGENPVLNDVTSLLFRNWFKPRLGARLLFPPKIAALDVNWGGDLVALALDDGCLRVFSSSDGQLVCSCRISKQGATCCQFVEDRVVVGDRAGMIHVFSVPHVKVLSSTALGCEGAVDLLAVSTHNVAAFAFNQQLTLKIAWLGVDGRELVERHELDDLPGPITFLAPAAQHSAGSLLLLGLSTGAIYVIDALLNTVLHVVADVHSEAIMCVGMSADHQTMISASRRKVAVLDISQQPPLPIMQLNHLPTPIVSAVSVGVGQLVFATGSHLVHLLRVAHVSVDDHKLSGCSHTVDKKQTSVDQLALSRSRRVLAALTNHRQHVALFLCQS